MIVDSHIHYIEAPRPDRPHVNAATVHPVSVDAIIEAARQAGVDRVVQVTASTMGDDNRFSFEGAAARPDRVLGVVGRFDPLAPAVEARVRAYAAQPGALGIRVTLFHDWSRPWLHERRLDPFLTAAARCRMPVFMHAPGQTDALLATVARHPDTRFVIDHMNIRYEAGMTAEQCFAHWPSLLRLSAARNVWIKVSYGPEAAFGSESYPFASAIRRLGELADSSGTARWIWGSNYPPVERACTYRQALDFIRLHCDFLSPAERSAVLGGNFLTHFAAGSRQRED